MFNLVQFDNDKMSQGGCKFFSVGKIGTRKKEIISHSDLSIFLLCLWARVPRLRNGNLLSEIFLSRLFYVNIVSLLLVFVSRGA